ncbi:hypothetical protein [Luteimonas saliphila]|uniref:hypothetical protein n=1 Tax=Luteimonas saliphila TaxID=2804919 RepID=UPI00192D5316|nr:hypothetical protein [Luteimonas saliphila]
MQCNLCGCRDFVDMNGRKAIRCRDCSSLERTRLLWMYFLEISLPAGARILHVAPEKGIHDAVSRIHCVDRYTCADIDPGRYAFAKCEKIDLCDLDHWPSSHLDLIMHCHVLEHVPCTLAYPLYHLHRMMKPSGRHLCVIPFTSGKYDESFQEISVEERVRRFGQFDHVRRFGNQDIGSHLGKLLRLPEVFDATYNFPEERLREANIPEPHWRGFHISTVLNLGRDDMLLLRGA